MKRTGRKCRKTWRKAVIHTVFLQTVALAVFLSVWMSALQMAEAAPGDLIISQYIEDASNNKALEFYTTTSAPLAVTPVHQVQGSGTVSPLEGNTVTVEGIVVGDYQKSSELSGFFVQEEDTDTDADPSTSEGIFVYSTTPVDTGDLVQVTGEVAEYFGLTEITGVSSVTVISSGNPLPAPAAVSLPLNAADDLEAYEGMYVTVPQTLYVTEHYNLGRGGFVTLSSGERLYQPTQVAEPGTSANTVQTANDLNRIILDDGSQRQNPEPIPYSSNPPSPLSAANTLRGGDTVTGLTGVLSYHRGGWNGSDNAYRIHPTVTPGFVSANPRPGTPPDAGGTLTVAAFNVLNYFTTIDTGSAGCGPQTDQGCRGADSSSELIRQQDKLIAALSKLDADIIGLMELENTDQNAIADLAARLPGYGYVANPGGDGAELGDDVITVGILYKTASVTPAGGSETIPEGYGGTDLGSACGSVSDGVFPFDEYNRKPLAQTFQDSGGETFTVVVNHFKSKGSLTGYAADNDQGDGQGNNNCTRTQAAETLLNWLATDPTGSGDEDFLIMGDLNSYAMEDPITTFTSAGYVNPVSGYSFVFDGQWGSLDYILASPGLAPQVAGGAKWHINADEPRILDYNEEFKTAGQLTSLYSSDEFRTSDHDPVLVGLSPGDCNCLMEGDGNGNLKISLEDVIYILQVLSGMEVSPAPCNCVTNGDISGSSLVDLEDTIYLLQVVSDMRL